jgi:glycosyltransferase involved in cell wall biosynthesis
VETEDTFLMGMVAANFGSRKNIPNHLEAFKMFLDEVDEDAVLYIHTHPRSQNGYDLTRIAKEIGIPKHNIIWPPEDHRGDAPDKVLLNWYNAMDVHINCSMGESWGLTVTESQMCGTPNIVTNFSSMPEQLGLSPGDHPEAIEPVEHSRMSRGGIYKAPHGVVVDPSAPIYKEKVNSKQMLVHPGDIFKAMRYYYYNEEQRLEDAEEAHEYVSQNYTLRDHVMPQWYDMFDELERRLA